MLSFYFQDKGENFVFVTKTADQKLGDGKSATLGNCLMLLCLCFIYELCLLL